MKAAEVLASHFGTLDALMNASKDELLTVPDVGETTADALLSWFQSPQSQDLIARLRAAGVNFESHNQITDTRFAGKTFVLTGALSLFTRDEATAKIESFGGKAAGTLRFLTGQVIPTLKQQFALPGNVRIILGGYSLAGLFALWASTQTALFSGVAAASPSVWFPGWMEFEQQNPIQAQCIYLSLGDREERTRNATMAAVGDNIRALHRELAGRGKNCTLEWNNGGHFKDTDLRTAKAFRWAMEEQA